jgi:glycosyltransferase involved in cell wall biosynthesis
METHEVNKFFVSVIIPTYNCGWCIKAAIDSVFLQTFTDYEIIVVDDGSTDDTKARISTIENSRLKYIYQRNAGRAAARNAGIKAAVGEWVAFLDADDLWQPSRLEQQIIAIQTNPNVIMLYGQSIPFIKRNPETGELIEPLRNRVIGCGKPFAADYVKDFLLARYSVPTSTVLARRKVLFDTGGFDPQFTITEDWDLFMRLALHGPVYYINEPLAFYWVGPFRTSLERGQRYDWHQELLSVVEKNLQLSGISKTDPVFAGEVLATWEWRCALVEHGLKRFESAKLHAEKALTYKELLFKQDSTITELVNFLSDIIDRDASVKLLEDHLISIVTDLVPTKELRKSFYRKCLAHLYAIKAFNAYTDNAPIQGLRYALIAAFFDLHWLKNRGLWTQAIRGISRYRQA